MQKAPPRELGGAFVLFSSCGQGRGRTGDLPLFRPCEGLRFAQSGGAKHPGLGPPVRCCAPVLAYALAYSPVVSRALSPWRTWTLRIPIAIPES